MKTAIAALLTSKKFLTMIVGLVVALGARYGLALEPELVAAILGMFAVLIGAQGAVDHGKAAAEIDSKSNQAAVATLAAAAAEPAKEPTVIVEVQS